LRTLPNGCATLSVERSRGKGPKCFLTGPQLTPVERVPEPGQVLFGVRLQPGVAFLLTNRAVHKVTDRRVPLAALLPQDASRMEKRMAVAARVDDGLDVLEEFLLIRLEGIQIDSRVQEALQRIENSAGKVRITQLTKDCQVSSRNLDRLFRTWVGFSPKRMARIVRFQVLLQRMETARRGGSAGLAAELGYYDQSHLVNEVAQFAAAKAMHVASRYVADFSKTRCE